MAVPLDRVVVVAGPLPDPVSLSIVIPVLNEAEMLQQSLARLFKQLQALQNFEVIVCDGGSKDQTPSIAGQFPCQLIHSTPGRASQMNRASELARGEWLLFLHVDSRLPDEFEIELQDAEQWGFFHLRLSGDHFFFPVIATAINLRSSITRVAGGDQALFFRKSFFQAIHGFPEIPLMEDVAICKTARRLSRPHIIRRSLTSSSRRWQEHGIVKTIVLMWSLRLAYWLGINPLRLHKIYYPQGER